MAGPANSMQAWIKWGQDMVGPLKEMVGPLDKNNMQAWIKWGQKQVVCAGTAFAIAHLIARTALPILAATNPLTIGVTIAIAMPLWECISSLYNPMGKAANFLAVKAQQVWNGAQAVGEQAGKLAQDVRAAAGVAAQQAGELIGQASQQVEQASQQVAQETAKMVVNVKEGVKEVPKLVEQDYRILKEMPGPALVIGGGVVATGLVLEAASVHPIVPVAIGLVADLATGRANNPTFRSQLVYAAAKTGVCVAAQFTINKLPKKFQVGSRVALYTLLVTPTLARAMGMPISEALDRTKTLTVTIAIKTMRQGAHYLKYAEQALKQEENEDEESIVPQDTFQIEDDRTVVALTMQVKELLNATIEEDGLVSPSPAVCYMPNIKEDIRPQRVESDSDSDEDVDDEESFLTAVTNTFFGLFERFASSPKITEIED